MRRRQSACVPKTPASTRTARLAPTHFRAIFISDIHLGFSGCSAGYLLDFLRSTTCDVLYLVGDIIDVWQMKKRLFWPQEHNDVVRTILGKAKHGTRVIYVPGNHDELLRDFDGVVLGNLEIRRNHVHVTRGGVRLLVMHGDEFDGVVRCPPTLARVGSSLYELLLVAHRLVNFLRRKLGLSYWSLAGVVKTRVKRAVTYIANFEAGLAHAARHSDAQGLIAGHIHRAELGTIDDIVYANCGDWVESCTALVERTDGVLELLHWTEHSRSLKQLDLAAA
jgi:UDP-2,3-diacylglucosamine pyrophosphatase LpxH